MIGLLQRPLDKVVRALSAACALDQAAQPVLKCSVCVSICHSSIQEFIPLLKCIL